MLTFTRWEFSLQKDYKSLMMRWRVVHLRLIASWKVNWTDEVKFTIFEKDPSFSFYYSKLFLTILIYVCSILEVLFLRGPSMV